MKVTHLSHTDARAGAGRAAYRIHHALRALGVDSTLLVGDKRTEDGSVISTAGHGYRRLRARSCEYVEAKVAGADVLF